MTWGYFSEFWDAITQVGDYTIEWFQNIGNAVAGAIGSFFDNLIHHFFDIFNVLEYFVQSLGDFWNIIFNPLTWIWNFVKGFFNSAFTAPIEPEITWTFSDQILGVFQQIPYWDIFTFSIGAGISIVVLVFALKKIMQI